MKPGSELDAVIAKEIFECKVQYYTNGPNCTCTNNPHNYRDWVNLDQMISYDSIGLKKYSTNIEAAFEVVNWFQENHWLDVFTLYGPCDENNDWWAIFEKKWHGRNHQSIYECSSGDSASEAICNAALKAIGYEAPADDQDLVKEAHKKAIDFIDKLRKK